MTPPIKVKKGKISRKKEQYWPMRLGGPYSKAEGDAKEIFKCTGCGAVTKPKTGWSGTPDKHHCLPGCQCNHGDWKPGGVTQIFRKNFDQIYPNAPGAGL
ncbi:MAG TPA: hypothetical protein DCG53_06150 [Syntrophus sp. (in: bacteria)]|nr:hypothetical protein [Syntrophus sp. (in: bacteria)]